ncbi:MAG TPA: hypothetical protein VEU07_05965, partial [Candidatus Acidoferrum sp.]|nr:hypothetical protein [Candidatus Acidoferrum sp.]
MPPEDVVKRTAEICAGSGPVLSAEELRAAAEEAIAAGAEQQAQAAPPPLAHLAALPVHIKARLNVIGFRTLETIRDAPCGCGADDDPPISVARRRLVACGKHP